MSMDLTHRIVLSKQLPKQSVALILAGGRGSRLKDLTSSRAKPAVHFGGKFRIIDFTLSNCFNSGVRRIGVLTQYNSHTLVQHIQRGWSFINDDPDDFIDFLPAQQRYDTGDWYKGTADAIYQNLDIIRRYRSKYVIILAGDHIYKMDYSLLLLDHVEKNSQCTVACIKVPKQEATQYGIMSIDSEWKINKFIEKPEKPETLIDDPDYALASMGIYIFNADYLYDLLEKDRFVIDSSHDFGKNLIPMAVAEEKAYAHSFEISCVQSDKSKLPYWRDVGTLDAYWQANLDLASIMPELDIYDQQWPIRTHINYAPPAKFVQDRAGQAGQVVNSLISTGTIISGSFVTNSIIFPDVRVNSFCVIDSSIILPEANIGRNCRLHRCIIEKGCQVPEGLIVGEDCKEDERRFVCSEKGVVVITKEMLKRLEEGH